MKLYNPYAIGLNWFYERLDALIKLNKRVIGVQLRGMGERQRSGPENRQRKHDKELNRVHGYTPEELR